MDIQTYFLLLRKPSTSNVRIGPGTVLLLCLVLTTIFWGCAGKVPRQWSFPLKGVPATHHIPSIPFFPQTDYQCGPAALAMTLVWSGVPTDPEKLSPYVFTPTLKGSLQPTMIGAARRHGRLAYIIESPDELLQEVAGGHPVIVLLNLGLSWVPVWHYAVVIGYDMTAAEVVLHSGQSSRIRKPLKVFNNSWSRGEYWGLLTLPPQKLPVTAVESDYLQSVLGLEKAKMWSQAITAYRKAIDKWPHSFPAHMGIGNVYYLMGNLSAAEQAYRIAVRRFPQEGAAHNNLALSLFNQGKNEEALAAAKTAVSLGGAMSGTYQDTLEEIQSSLAESK